ncbi:MAG: class I SAM-dependent methyltransferase [Promethearchaeia archaeon]
MLSKDEKDTTDNVDPEVNKFFFNTPKLWDELTANQDRFQKQSKKILDIVGKIFPTYSISLLDVGCGTAGHFDLYTDRGIKCTGVDLNPNMIKYARRKYPETEFYIQDMKDLTFQEDFQVITCLNSTFLYNITNKEIISTLKSFQKALVSEGILIIDVSEPVTYLLHCGRKNFKKGYTYEISTNKISISVQISLEFLPKKQIYKGTRTFKRKNDEEILTKEPIKYRILGVRELKFFLEQCGFNILNVELPKDKRDLIPRRISLVAQIQE